MALGAITSLGVGSGLELQDILDQLREVDETSVNLKKTKKTKLEEQVTEFDTINAKLIQMKSSALSLSLESNFLERGASVSDEDIMSATVISGTKLSSYTIEVERLASKSSYQSAGVEAADSLMYTAPGTGIETNAESAVATATPLSFTIGHGEEQKQITLELAAGSSLKDIAQAINEADSNLDEGGTPYVKASVEAGTDGNYIRLSATDENSLNNNQILVSQGPGFIAPDLLFSYQIGSTSDAVYVAVPPGTTYEGVTDLINNDTNNAGMTATMIDDGGSETSWHLAFTADETGESHRISLNGITMEPLQGAEESLNASFTVDGYTYQRQSNDAIEDVIQGVTLNLKKTGETQLSISSESENMMEKITGLIETYNELVQDIDSKTQYSQDEEQDGILSNVYSVKTLGSTLSDLITTVTHTGGEFSSLMDLGMELNRDGTIDIDQSTLSDAFSNSPEEVAKLFIGDEDNGITGLGDILNDRLGAMTSNSGVLNGEKSAAEEKIDRLATDIETAQERLDQKYELMAQEFVRLDALIGTMNSQSEYLASVIDSFNNADS